MCHCGAGFFVALQPRCTRAIARNFSATLVRACSYEWCEIWRNGRGVESARGVGNNECSGVPHWYMNAACESKSGEGCAARAIAVLAAAPSERDA